MTGRPSLAARAACPPRPKQVTTSPVFPSPSRGRCASPAPQSAPTPQFSRILLARAKSAGRAGGGVPGWRDGVTARRDTVTCHGLPL